MVRNAHPTCDLSVIRCAVPDKAGQAQRTLPYIVPIALDRSTRRVPDKAGQALRRAHHEILLYDYYRVADLDLI